MSDPVTNNKSLIQMATGTASGTWGAVLNAAMIGIVDGSLGNTVSVPVSSSDVNLTTTQIQSLAFNLTGILTGAINVTLPLNPNSTTQAVGGFFVVDNESTGAFGVTVKTIVTGSLGVAVPQNVRSLVYSDGTNVWYADDAQNSIQTYNGNPNGNVAGTAGSASTRASQIIDRTTNIAYLATTSGTAASAVWSANLPFSFASQGYLTASADATNPVLTTDSIGATTIYYTAFRGNLMFIYNGISFSPVTITGGQLSLALSGSAQASNGIYDVIGFLDVATPRIAFSPAWATPAAGSGARGTGGGSPQLARINGILVNAVQQTVNNGATTYTVAANRGTYLGSAFIDSSSGQVTCHVTYGQSRKWGVWNAYNRESICLKAGDPTVSWTYHVNAIRASNNNSANSFTSFSGLAEEWCSTRFDQKVSTNGIAISGIGYNSTNTYSGVTGVRDAISTNSAAYEAAPSLGVNVFTCLEQGANFGGTWSGTNTNMQMTGMWRG